MRAEPIAVLAKMYLALIRLPATTDIACRTRSMLLMIASSTK
jgi:hypothetical protein